MLDYMRKNANSAVVWMIIGVISVVFIFFGIGPGGNQGQPIQVNGQDVTYADYNDTNEKVTRALVAQGLERGDNFQRIVREVTATEVINLYLRRQLGEELGLTPSDRAVAQVVMAIPQFQIEGQFSQELYKDTLRAMGTTTTNFEEEQRDNILLNRFNSLVAGLSRSYRPEALAYYHLEQDQLEFDYAFFPTTTYLTGLEPTPEELQDYFAKNQLTWLNPAEIKIEYVLVKPTDFVEQAVVSDEELRLQYEENLQRFTQEAQAEVSQILIRFATMDPDQASKEKTLAQAQEILVRTATLDFATLAKEVSEDAPSAALGGAMGTLEQGSNFLAFDELVFSDTPLNKVLGPVETPLGYHLIKVTSRQEAGTQPFEKARETLLGERRLVQGRNLAVAQLEDLIVRSETSPLAAAAASMGLTTTQVTFTQATAPEFLEGDVNAIQEIFAAPVGRVGSPLELKENLIIYTPMVLKKSQIPLLDEVRDEVTVAWTADESLSLARTEAHEFASQATTSGWAETLKKASEQKKVESGRTPLVSRSILLQSTPPFQEANPQEFSAAVFSVAQAGEVSPVAISGKMNGVPGGFALHLASLKPAAVAFLEGPMLQIFTSALSQQKGNMLYQAWQANVHRQANVNVPPQYLN